MKRYKVVSILMMVAMTVSLLSGCGCSRKEGEDPSINAKAYDFSTDDVSYDTQSDVNYINNIVLVFFYDAPSEARKAEVSKLAGGTMVGEDQNVDQIQVRVKSRSLDELKQLCNKLEQEEDIDYVTYDTAIRREKEPEGVEQQEKSSKSGKVQVSDEMKIGIVDSGFDADHEDLDITILNPDMANKNNHGTHVAGIIGATNNNGIGIDGVVPDAKMLGYDWEPGKGQDWDTASQTLIGVSTCVKNGAKVVNYSLGLSESDLKDDTYKKPKAVLDETAKMSSYYMSKLLEKGYDFVVVQAAGNGARNGYGVDAVNNGDFCAINKSNCKTTGDVTKEDIINRIIVVAAAYRPNKKGKVYLTDFSNGGSRVDVAAPGYEIYSCVCNNKYKKMSGTSMAAPMVSGYLAVEWDKNPSLTGDQLKGLLKSLPKKAYDNPYSENTSGDYPFVDLWYKFKDPDAKPVTTKAPTTQPPTTMVEDAELVDEDGLYYTELIQNLDSVESDEPYPVLKKYELNGNQLITYGDFWRYEDESSTDADSEPLDQEKRVFEIADDCEYYDTAGNPVDSPREITAEQLYEYIDSGLESNQLCMNIVIEVEDGEVVKISAGQS